MRAQSGKADWSVVVAVVVLAVTCLVVGAAAAEIWRAVNSTPDAITEARIECERQGKFWRTTYDAFGTVRAYDCEQRVCPMAAETEPRGE